MDRFVALPFDGQICSSPSGAVLGIDVGYSRRRRTTCFALLAWDQSGVRLRLTKAGRGPRERQRALLEAIGDCRLPLTVAVDGPLASGLLPWKKYRSCEALLSGGVMQRRGKPGQTSSPTGRQLHLHARLLARIAVRTKPAGENLIEAAIHEHAIHQLAVVEAFPNSFLAALLPESLIPTLDRDASDRFWEVLASGGRLEALLRTLLPSHKAEAGTLATTDHDERAAIVCALTALCVRMGGYVAVGDKDAGYIILPPLGHWGAGADGVPSLCEDLVTAVEKRRKKFPTALAQAVGSVRDPL